MTQATEAYREDSDVLGEFLGEYTERVADMDQRVLLTDLYQKYGTWCEESGRKGSSRQSLRKKLEERGFVSKHTRKGHAILRLQFKSDSECPFDSEEV